MKTGDNTAVWGLYVLGVFLLKSCLAYSGENRPLNPEQSGHLQIKVAGSAE